MPRTLVFKSLRSINSNELGTVIPVAIENDDGSVRAVSPDEYPNNNRIFISKEFSKIDETFNDRELFVLTTVNENLDHSGADSQSRSKFYSMGFYANSLDTNTYLPIIPMTMPDVASGKIEQGPSIDIGSKHFFILSEEVVSGPFLAQAENESWVVTPTNTTSPLMLTSWHIGQFNLKELDNAGLVLRSEIGGHERLFFTSLKKAKMEVGFKEQDYIPDSALIRLYAKNDYGKKDGNFTKIEATKLANSIDAYSKKNRKTSDIERTKRIKNVLNEYLKFDGVGVEIIQDYFNTQPGKAFVENYATAHRETLFKDALGKIDREHSDQKDKYEREISDVATKLESKRQELQQLELNMVQRKKEIQKEIETFNAQSKEQEQNALRDRNNKLMLEIETNEQALGELKLHVENYKDIASSKKEIAKMETRIEVLREQEYKLKKVVETQMNLIQNPQIIDRMAEFKTIQMLLNGIAPQTSDLIAKPITLPKYDGCVVGETRKSYINCIKAVLGQSSGRPYTYDETANLLLCTLQSYITILAGPPGTGKTSTVNRFADALGLIVKQKNTMETDNFLSIPVGRGWVTSRDILGFYNSLKNTYQPSRSGLYQFLKAFSNHATNEEDSKCVKLVLMDEANLSSIEHYWSDFLLMCDSFEENHRIDLGITSKEERYLQIPSSLRFMGTINNDATVENLSQRLIDRAAIITLGYDADSGTADTQSNILTGAVPYKELMDAFSPKNDGEDMAQPELLRLNPILEILSTDSIKGNQIRFSKRKINAITRYCHIAKQLEFEKTHPLDFAISQHILPSISGHGQGLRERLQRLDDKLGEAKYTVSRKIVTNIIETGDNFSDSYSFF